MATFEFKNLRAWPKNIRPRHHGDLFQSSYESTVAKLKEELRLIRVERAVVSIVYAKGSLRKDGLPMENANMTYPGVMISFDKPTGGVSLATDKYASWMFNLRGIALSLEALRGINRWGCSEQDQQYLGFPALPPPDPDILETGEDAARFIARLVDPDAEDALAETLLGSEAMYRVMRPQILKNTHPDQRNGQGNTEFAKFQKAEELLEQHYAGRV